MKKILFILLMVVISGIGSGKVIADFPDLLNPDRMMLGDGKLYVIQDYSVHVYSMKDFSLKKKVGKQGEGPGEFTGYLMMALHSGNLYLNSSGKLSVYTPDGEMIREVKSRDSVSGVYTPFRDKFIGRGMEIDKERNRFTLLNIYNKELIREKTVIREPHSSNFEKGVIIPFDSTFNFHILGKKLYLVNGREFEIDVYGPSMNKEKIIKWNYNKVKFGEKDKEKVIENLRTNPRIKAFADEILKRQRYPKYYPSILGLYDNGINLFVMTHRWEGNNIEFLIFDPEGKYIQQLFIPFTMKSLYRAYPWDIKGNRFLQLLENEDDEWELHESILNLK
ncbi:MAG: hypothetical protein ABFR36_04225 [Acidobacteriota bacterium]